MKRIILTFIAFCFVLSLKAQADKTPGYYHPNSIQLVMATGQFSFIGYERKFITTNTYKVGAKIGAGYLGNGSYTFNAGPVAYFGKKHNIEIEFLETFEKGTDITEQTFEEYSYTNFKSIINAGYRVFFVDSKWCFRIGTSGSFSTRKFATTKSRWKFGEIYLALGFNFT